MRIMIQRLILDSNYRITSITHFPHIPKPIPLNKSRPLHAFILRQNYAFIINCVFKIPMNFRKIKRNTQSTRKCMDQLTSTDNENEKSSSLQEFVIKSKMWRIEQQKCFIRFWAYRLLQSPLQVLSFHSPLKRSSYFKEMSAFFAKLLGVQYYKNAKQCKSRFGAIKRKVLKEQKLGLRRQDFDFLDYIIEQGNRFAEEEDIHPRTGLRKTMQKLKQLENKESDFMIHIKKLLKFDLECEVEQKNNEIVKYLKMKNQTLK